jgi:hypothetical protein
MNPIQMSPTLLPPPPPTVADELLETFINVNVYGTGSFEYIKHDGMRTQLKNAWLAVTLTESWGFIKQKIESFTWSTHPRVSAIYAKMEELGYYGHSGASFGNIMREIQFIALYGEQEYIKHAQLSGYCREIC